MIPPLHIEVNSIAVLVVLGAYQLYLQVKSEKRTRYKEGLIRRLQYLIGIPALGLLASFIIDPDILAWAYVPLPEGWDTVGQFLFNISAAVIIWSHITLGKFWSGELETRKDHAVVDTGPYAYVRHPLYSSYLFLTAGFFLMTGNWLVGAVMFGYFFAVAARAFKEEEMLKERIGHAYELYMEKTGRFIPSVDRRVEPKQR